jgi:hypothetical protein
VYSVEELFKDVPAVGFILTVNVIIVVEYGNDVRLEEMMLEALESDTAVVVDVVFLSTVVSVLMTVRVLLLFVIELLCTVGIEEDILLTVESVKFTIEEVMLKAIVLL